MRIHYYQGHPEAATCDCGHTFEIDPCTEEGLMTIRKLDGRRVNVAKCPVCGKVDYSGYGPGLLRHFRQDVLVNWRSPRMFFFMLGRWFRWHAYKWDKRRRKWVRRKVWFCGPYRCK